jgi:hypothetical protein
MIEAGMYSGASCECCGKLSYWPVLRRRILLKQNACLQGQYSLRVHILECMFGLGVMMIENDDDQKGMYLLIYLLQSKNEVESQVLVI